MGQPQLVKWVRAAWGAISELTPLRRLAQVITGIKNVKSESAVQIYGHSLSRVTSLLGKDFSIVTPVTLLSDHSVVSASVDISCLMASFLTVARFKDSNKKLWAALDRAEIINTLFPTEGTHPKLGMESAISKLTELDKT